MLTTQIYVLEADSYNVLQALEGLSVGYTSVIRTEMRGKVQLFCGHRKVGRRESADEAGFCKVLITYAAAYRPETGTSSMGYYWHVQAAC